MPLIRMAASIQKNFVFIIYPNFLSCKVSQKSD